MSNWKDMQNCKENAEYVYDTFAYDTTYRYHKVGTGMRGTGQPSHLLLTPAQDKVADTGDSQKPSVVSKFAVFRHDLHRGSPAYYPRYNL